MAASSAPLPTTAPVNWPPPVDAALPGYTPFYWAVSAVNDLNVRSGSGTEHPVVAQIDAGTLVLVTEPLGLGGWNGIVGDGFVGFVSPGPEDHPYLRATPARWESHSARLAGVASDGSTYLAWGSMREEDYLPWEGGGNFLLFRSEDGLTWTQTERDATGAISTIAGSAKGWVRITSHYPDVSLISYSADGKTWERSQMLYGSAIAYGPGGWVAGGVWRSTDGRSWSETTAFDPADPAPDGVEASDAGYLAFVRCAACYEGGINRPLAWASLDGASWTAVSFPPGAGWVSDAELIGDRVLILTTDQASGESTLHHGKLSASGGVTWTASPSRVDAGGFRVDSISQGPGALLALGWDSAALVPAAWRSTDGASWDRLDMPSDALGGSVGVEPSWGSGGWVALGTSADGAGQQLWRSVDGEAWQPTGESVGYSTPAPACPPAEKVSTLVLAYLGPEAERCLGNASVTIRGWVPQDQGWRGCCPPISAPSWLAGYPSGYILPAEAGGIEQARGLLLYLPPGVEESALQPSQWVEVVGHFREAAAATCSYAPQSDYPDRLGSLKAAQLGCRQRFVVESIRAVDGP